jgi:hypothetical protein
MHPLLASQRRASNMWDDLTTFRPTHWRSRLSALIGYHGGRRPTADVSSSLKPLGERVGVERVAGGDPDR